MVSWTVVNSICILAAFIQLVFIIANYINPVQLNTIASEIALKDIDFPLDIKICAEPAFNESAIFEAGYERKIYKYFIGRSRFNKTVVGWAGHTKDYGTVGSVEEVLDKVRNHKVDDVIKGISFNFENETLDDILVTAHLNRVNYPQNCYTVNLTKLNKARRETMKTLWMYFKRGKTKKITIHLQGRTLATNRDVFDNTYNTVGDEIFVESGKSRKYAVGISKNIYLEEDKSKNCRNYPNPDFVSYLECDEQYMRNICDSVNLAPVWLYGDFKKVTKTAAVNYRGIFIYL